MSQKLSLENNARHEAGHWISGWVLGKASLDIVLVVPGDGNGDCYCDREPHPDFLSLDGINKHLSERIINLLSGAKAESYNGFVFNQDMFNYLISDYAGAWPDYFIAGELFRYYYRTIPSGSRGSYREEWEKLLTATEKLIVSNYPFISEVVARVLGISKQPGQKIVLKKDELVTLYSRC